ncbi:MAG: hypothetical protein ABUT39_05280 [Acidobacteriota bacterium]
MSFNLKGQLTALLLAFACVALASSRPAQAAYSLGYGELVRQDFSDCGNNNVSVSGDYSRVGGAVTIVQTSTGATTVIVKITNGTPNTGYHFFWKCMFWLGQVQTDASGTGAASFTLQTAVGQTFTFDMYPDGAPLGNKFQSVRITPTIAARVGGGSLIRQDQSDCDNSDVTASNPSTIGGNVTLVQNVSGVTAALVQITGGVPSVTYDFYWKCRLWVGRVQTDATGAGTAALMFYTVAGQTLAFDTYPMNGNAPGNVLQSVPVTPAAY